MHWLSQRFELSRGGGADNVRPMEGLRGFAVFLVFLVHYVTLVKPWVVANPILLEFSSKLHTIGNAGVDLFFVLSGYLIYGSLITRYQPFAGFMMRRVQRIYPAFITVFLTYIFLSFVFPAENKIPSGAIDGAIYLIQNFFLLPGLFPIEPMITVAWSLSYEMFYYLVTPVIIGLFGLRKRRSNWRVIFFVAVAIAFFVFSATCGGPIRLNMFVSGILLYEVVSSKHLSTPSSSFGLLALCVGLLGTLLPVTGNSGSAIKIWLLFVSFFVLCLSCFRNPTEWLARVFSLTPLRWLGNMSYSYYLLHGLALKAGFLLLTKVFPASGSDSPLWFWILLPIMFSLTLIPSTVLFLAIERPLSLIRHPTRSDGRTSPKESIAQVPALPK
jgi:peptidoglycan/LPS O-acetylase OafA/YrhL